MTDESAGLTGCGCLILSIGLGVAFVILCVGASWWAVSSAWRWSFG